MDEIQQDHAARTANRAERPLDAFRVARNGANGKSSGLLLEVHTSNATEVCSAIFLQRHHRLTSHQTSITLEEIESVDGFVNNLEKIELPNQLIAVLGDPLLQKLLTLKPQAEAYRRTSNWLASYGQDLTSGDSGIDHTDGLEILKAYVSRTKV